MEVVVVGVVVGVEVVVGVVAVVLTPSAPAAVEALVALTEVRRVDRLVVGVQYLPFPPSHPCLLLRRAFRTRLVMMSSALVPSSHEYHSSSTSSTTSNIATNGKSAEAVVAVYPVVYTPWPTVHPARGASAS